MMVTFTATVQSYFTTYLLGQRAASAHTLGAYRDTWRMLLSWVHDTTGTRPSDIGLDDLHAETITGFLHHLATERGNGAATRNARLAAIHSLFAYAAYRHPDHAEVIARVLAIRAVNTHTEVLTWLTDAEVSALLAAPDLTTWVGRRDHAIMLTLATTGLRVGELIGLTHRDLHLTKPTHVAVHGKGRKDRIIPLQPATAAALRRWAAADPAPGPDSAVFHAQGRTGPISTDAIAARIRQHTRTAAGSCPSLAAKNVTPHTMRHSFAMKMRSVGTDATTIALWMGHESPQSSRPYLHADLGIKQRALERLSEPGPKSRPYKPADKLLAFLEGL